MNEYLSESPDRRRSNDDSGQRQDPEPEDNAVEESGEHAVGKPEDEATADQPARSFQNETLPSGKAEGSSCPSSVGVVILTVATPSDMRTTAPSKIAAIPCANPSLSGGGGIAASRSTVRAATPIPAIPIPTRIAVSNDRPLLEGVTGRVVYKERSTF